MGMNVINSLSHTKWNCKYHIVFYVFTRASKANQPLSLFFWYAILLKK